jgi:glucosamine-6-phosphate deaminase
MYTELVDIYRREGLDFSGVRVFSLDEFIGVPAHDPRSFHHYLWDRFIRHVNIPPDNIHLPSSTADARFCRDYEDRIASEGGIDLLVAGIGPNGHIAFNEPGSLADSRTRVVELADSTIANMRSVFAEGELPRRAVTIGIATILEARSIFVLATGLKKKYALAGVLHGPVTSVNPASFVRQHSDVTVIADTAAVDG